MPSIRILPAADKQVIKEDTVGFANTAIVYAGLQSCISITGIHSGGLVGVHLTVSSDIDNILKTLRSIGGLSCSKFYVIGALQNEFKPNTSSANFNTRKKIRNRVKELVNKSAQIYFFDSPGESHVYVKKVNHSIKFYRISQYNNDFTFKANTPIADVVKGIGLQYQEFNGLTEININAFNQR